MRNSLPSPVVDKSGMLMLASKAKSYRQKMHGMVMGGKTAGEPTWHTSERCDGGACVEIGTTGEAVLIRNSKAPDGKYITLTRDEWQMFVASVKDGDFDSF